MKQLVVVLILLAQTVSAQVAIPVAQMVFPSFAGAESVVMSSTGNELRCWVLPSPHTVVNATQLSFGVVTAVGGSTCSIGLYTDSDSTSGTLLLGSASAEDCSTAGAKNSVAAAVTITAGTAYRLCMCSSSATSQAKSVGIDASSGERVTDMLNSGVNRSGVYAQACSSGTLPSGTGAQTSQATFAPPLVVIEQ